MSLPKIHGTCKLYDYDNMKCVTVKCGNYGGLRRYAECKLKHKLVEGNSKCCKHWELEKEEN